VCSFIKLPIDEKHNINLALIWTIFMTIFRLYIADIRRRFCWAETSPKEGGCGSKVLFCISSTFSSQQQHKIMHVKRCRRTRSLNFPSLDVLVSLLCLSQGQVGCATWYTTHVSSTSLTTVLCDPLLLC
jgi:hypothetical protein